MIIQIDLFFIAFARTKSFAVFLPLLPNAQMPHFSSPVDGDGSNPWCFGLDSHLNYFHFAGFIVNTDIYSKNFIIYFNHFSI